MAAQTSTQLISARTVPGSSIEELPDREELLLGSVRSNPTAIATKAIAAAVLHAQCAVVNATEKVVVRTFTSIPDVVAHPAINACTGAAETVVRGTVSGVIDHCFPIADSQSTEIVRR